MRSAAHPRRTTALVGALLALLLVGGWVGSARLRDARPGEAPGPVVAQAPSASPTPSPAGAQATGPPRPGRAYPVRDLGPLGGRSRIVTLRGNAELRYGRAPGGATRVHFICTGCDADTWLSTPGGAGAAGPGRLDDPAYATAALDTAPTTRAGRGSAGRSRLLVKAPSTAEWTVTLTPFDEVPVHTAGFDSLGDDVVAVRAEGPLLVTCPGPSRLTVLARPSRTAAYAVVSDERHGGGPQEVAPAAGADVRVLVVTCGGRWTLTVP